MKIELVAGQMWRVGTGYIRVVKVGPRLVEYKVMQDLDHKVAPLSLVSQKEFIDLLKARKAQLTDAVAAAKPAAPAKQPAKPKPAAKAKPAPKLASKNGVTARPVAKSSTAAKPASKRMTTVKAPAKK